MKNLLKKYEHIFHKKHFVFLLLLLFIIVNLSILFGLIRPWEKIKDNNWQCGFESGRIARNILSGYGYSSPFIYFKNDKPIKPPQPVTTWGKNAYRQVFFIGKAQAKYDCKFDGKLMKNNKICPTCWVTPPGVFFWLFVFSIFGIYTAKAMMAYLVIEIFMMSGAILLFYRTLDITISRNTATIFLLFSLSYPLTYFFSIRGVHHITIWVLIISFAFYSLARFANIYLKRFLILHIFFSALAVLTIPASLIFVMGVELMLFIVFIRENNIFNRLLTQVQWGRKKFAINFITIWLLAIVFIWGPWFARNFIEFKKVVIFKNNASIELWFGNNEYASFDPIAAHYLKFPAMNQIERKKLLKEGEVKYSQQCKQLAISFIENNPSLFLYLSARRFLFFWTLNLYKKNPLRPYLTIIFLFYLILFLIFLKKIGISSWGIWEWVGVLCISFYPLAYYFTHFSGYRYRFPLEMILLFSLSSVFSKWLYLMGKIKK